MKIASAAPADQYRISADYFHSITIGRLGYRVLGACSPDHNYFAWSRPVLEQTVGKSHLDAAANVVGGRPDRSRQECRRGNWARL